VRQIPDAVDTVVCAPDDGWKYHPKHVEQFPVINKRCNVVSCWIYEYIEILFGAHPIFHISRIRDERNRKHRYVYVSDTSAILICLLDMRYPTSLNSV
jgi:hypothetical protein